MTDASYYEERTYYPTGCDPDTDGINALAYGVKVEWRGQGKWAVKNGPRYLSRTGKWLFLPQRMNWRWCRFPFTEACQWAESTVDDVRCNGMTWTEWQSWVAAKQAAAAP
jgi:hypothetical protein